MNAFAASAAVVGRILIALIFLIPGFGKHRGFGKNHGSDRGTAASILNNLSRNP
jgi:hypothetical protein